MNYSSDALSHRLGENALIHISHSNSHLLDGTNKGIDVAGDRLSWEVREVIRQHPFLKEISFVGNGIGGLIVRYAISKLYEVDPHCIGNCVATIAGLTPVNYITFATPHMGCRGSVSWFAENLWSYIDIVKPTTEQLFFRDKQQSGLPLLYEMSIGNTIYMKALGLFKHRILYANIEGDHRVSYQSGAIWPYRLDGAYWEKPFNFDPKYNNIVVRPAWVTPEKGNTYYAMSSEETQIAFDLLSLSWDRYDVYFDGWFASWLNHDNIIVADKEVNSIGRGVVHHFVDTFPLK